MFTNQNVFKDYCGYVSSGYGDAGVSGALGTTGVHHGGYYGNYASSSPSSAGSAAYHISSTLSGKINYIVKSIKLTIVIYLC